MTNEDQLLLKKGAEILGIRLSRDQVKLFDKYLGELNTWRKRLNLVSREDDREIIIKDFLDSLTVVSYLPDGSSLADCGSGAGLPGVPIKIARPDVRVCLFDSTRKKIFFLNHLLRVLGLKEIQTAWTGDRASPAEKAQFDFAVARAFGPLEKIQTVCGTWVRPGGILLAMKGTKGKNELDGSLPALEEHGWELAFAEKALLPFLGHERILIGFRKKEGIVPRGTMSSP